MREIKEIIEIVATIDDKGKRLDTFLTEKLDGFTKSYIQKLVEGELVEIKGKSKTRTGNKLKGNEKISIKILEEEISDIIGEDIPLDIVYQDKHLVIINKQPNLVVHPAVGNTSGTLVNGIIYHIKDLSDIGGIVRPGIVHRLDKNTSGLIIVAKTNEAHVKLTEMFKERKIEKTYLALCKGRFKEERGRIENNIGRHPKERKKMAVLRDKGKKAITNYEVLTQSEHHSLVRVGLETGRTHQIRVHMKHLNHSILGDETYGKKSKLVERQMLHAYSLKFIHPITGEVLDVKGELPNDFKSILKTLEMEYESLI